MKRFLGIIMLVFCCFLTSCNKKDEVDFSNLNEELFDINVYEPTNCDFIGHNLERYLYFVETINSHIDALLLDYVLADIKDGSYQSASYANGTYKIQKGSVSYKVTDVNLSRYDDEELIFEYELNDAEKLFKIYSNGETSFEYYEASNKITGRICDTNEFFSIEKSGNKIILGNSYQCNAYRVNREIYLNNGAFVNFEVAIVGTKYNLYRLIDFGLTSKQESTGTKLVHSNGKKYESYKYKNDDSGIYIYSTTLYDLYPSVDVILCLKDNNLMDVLVEYIEPVINNGATPGLRYAKIDGKEEYYLQGATGIDVANIVVASEYNGLPVTYVGEGIDVFGEYYSEFNSLDNFKMTLPYTIKGIGRLAFARSKLEEISIPEGCLEIEDYAFALCNLLDTIILPKSIDSLGIGIFSECSNIKEITYLGTKAEWEMIVKNGWNKDSLIEVVKCSDGDVEIQ